MKKIMLQIAVIVIANMTVAYAQTYSVNDLVVTDQWRWIDVVNPDEVFSGNNAFSFGGSCGIAAGDELRVIGIDDGNYLLRVEKRNPAYGTVCSSDILFFMDFSTVESMKGVFEKKKAAEEKAKAKVKRLIKKHAEGE